MHAREATNGSQSGWRLSASGKPFGDSESSRSHDAVIRVYDAAGNVIETHEHTGDFKEW
jgi:hypothetical protein